MNKLLCFVGALLACSAAAHTSPEELKNLQWPDVAIESAAHHDADLNGKSKTVAHTAVTGVIGGHIRFELLLPDDWNGNFVMGGGGGFVGTVQNGERGAVNHGYATVGTDTGHQATSGYLAGWALDNPEAQLNFGYLAVHRTAVTAKALVRAFYGTNASRSYFLGCSRGGGQAMMEAQRFPEDFDGIVAGAPAFNWTALAACSTKIQQTLYPDPAKLDHTALDRPALERLSRSVMDQCDAADGLKDGVVQNPLAVKFDLDKVPGLDEGQRKSVAAIYAGARLGDRVICPGYTAGAECDPDQWLAWIVGPAPSLAKDHVPDLMFAFGTQIFKYLVFDNPDWNYATYDFQNFDRDTRLASACLNATNANLDGLKQRKGRLIIWHGWADPALPALATVDYYRQVQAHDAEAAQYCRLYMIPGCLHCGGGPGASEVDWLGLIVDWVEHDQAPDRIVARRHAKDAPEKSRPLYPFPAWAVYGGTGDPNKAESFVMKRPE